MKIYDYNTEVFPFKEIITTILEVEKLEKLHEIKTYEIFSREKDQSSDWHKKYYSNFHKFNDLYLKFLKEIIKPIFNNEEIVYQKIPTFRVQLVGNLGVGQFHRDRDYNHGIDEINFWLPFVNVYGNNSIWVESEEGRNDLHPIKLNYGQILEFDGANLLHGNKINDSISTRVSVDFRVLTYKNFKPSTKGSINTNSKFDIGGYFEKI
jgi:hypothetical protein